MLVPSVMGAPLLWAGVSPVAVYNVLIIAGLAYVAWMVAGLADSWLLRVPGGLADPGAISRHSGPRAMRCRSNVIDRLG